MTTLKNTLDILTNPWNDEFSNPNVSPRIIPTTEKWDDNKEITISDVVTWEQLYYEPGNIGVYVAYNPYADYYLITYNLLFDTEFQFEEFSGKDAAQKCYNRLVELGIYLDYI